MSDIITYRGYQGQISYEDGILFIKILHIDDFVSSECDAASEAQSCFEKLVDDYIETCADIGKNPQKPFKGSFNVRVDPTLHRQAAMAAAEVGQTLNSWVREAMRLRIEKTNQETQ